MATSEGIPSSIDIEFLELNDNPYVNEQVRDKTIRHVPAYDDKPYSEVKGSYTSSKVEGNTLTVTFAPNETQDGRYVRVVVSAGDIFDKIIFVQKPE